MNQILTKVEQGILAKADAKTKPAVLRIVAAGMKIMFDKRTHGLMLEQINKPGDLIENIGQGVADLMILMYRQSRGTMPLQAAIPASVILLCHALDYTEKSNRIQASNDVVAKATKAMMAYLMQKMGITPEKMQEVGMMARRSSPDGQTGVVREGV